MYRGRFQDRIILTGINSPDRTNIPFSKSLTRKDILHKYEPAAPLQGPSHCVITLILKVIGKILMNRSTPLLTMKS